MTTIAQLPLAAEVGSQDLIPISQQNVLYAATVGQVVSGLQTTITLPTGDLLGRVSAGAGSPEAVNIGLGLNLVSGTITATGSDHAGFPVQTTLSLQDELVLSVNGQPALLGVTSLRSLFSAGTGVTIDGNGSIAVNLSAVEGSTGPQGPAGVTGLQGPVGPQGPQGLGLVAPSTSNLANFIGGNDCIAIWQNGANNWITYQQLIGGQTIDQLPSAGPAQDSDQILVAQNSNNLSSQSFSAIWAYIANKLPTLKLNIVELVSNTVLDGTKHNGRIIVVSQPLTLTANYANMGSGFMCRVVNLSTGTVIMGAGITTSSGAANILPPGNEAVLIGMTYSGGSIVWWSGTAPTAPSLTISTINPFLVSVPFIVTGSFYNDALTSLDYSFDGTIWVAAVSPKIGFSSYSFLLPGLAAGLYSLHVRDHANQSLSAISNSFQIQSPNISFSIVPNSAFVGESIVASGAVTPSNAAVQVGFSSTSSISPINFLPAISVSGIWNINIVPETAGTIYLWAQLVEQPSTVVVSQAILVNNPTISVDTPAGTNVGSAIQVGGSISSGSPVVTVQLSTQNTTAPVSSGVPSTIIGVNFSAILTPSAAGTFYIWAQDQAAGLSAVSGAINITAQLAVTYTVNQPSIISYAHGSGTIAVNGTINPAQNIGTQVAISTSNTAVPISGWQPASIIDNNMLWALYLATPAEPGSYYIWVETTNQTAAAVSSFTLTIT
jgi:hypothetical protein